MSPSVTMWCANDSIQSLRLTSSRKRNGMACRTQQTNTSELFGKSTASLQLQLQRLSTMARADRLLYRAVPQGPCIGSKTDNAYFHLNSMQSLSNTPPPSPHNVSTHTHTPPPHTQTMCSFNTHLQVEADLNKIEQCGLEGHIVVERELVAVRPEEVGVQEILLPEGH